MASLLDILKQAGNVAGTGIGAALTPLAMVQAAQSGRNPFEVLRQAQGGGLQQQLQQQQLANAQQEGLAARAARLQDPAVRALLTQQPELAPSFGIESTPVASMTAAPGILQRVQAAAPLGAMIPDLPPQVATTQELQRQASQARTGYLDFSTRLLAEQLGIPPEQLGAAPGTAAPGGTLAPPTAAPARRLRTTFGPGGATFSPDPTIAKAQTEAMQQRIRSTGAFGMLDDLEASVNRIYTAESPAGIPKQAASLYWAALQGDPDAVNIQTAVGRLPVLVEALQRDGRISNQDASFLLGNLPYFYDGKRRALSKLSSIRRTLEARNINLQAELDALGGAEERVTNPGAAPSPGPAEAPVPSVNPNIEAARERVRALGGGGGRLLQRAKGGPIPTGRTAIVGEYGPELVSGPAQVTPMRLAGGNASLRQDFRQRATQAEQGQARQTRRLQAAGGQSPLPSTGGGGFQAGTGTAPSMPPPATPRTLTAAQLGGAMQPSQPQFRIEVGPDLTIRQVPIR